MAAQWNKGIPKIKMPYEGKKQGRLLVQECLIASEGDSNFRGLYRCLCDCGKVVEARGTSIKQGKCSCGCLQQEARLNTGYLKRTPEKTTYTIQYHSHKRGALGRGYTFFTRDVWLSFVIQPCHYCGGIDRRNSMGQKSNRKGFVNDVTQEELDMYEVSCNGIDRVDSKKGYELDNCVPCCAQCNYMKIQYPQEQFLKKAEQIHTYTTYNQVSLDSFLCN